MKSGYYKITRMNLAAVPMLAEYVRLTPEGQEPYEWVSRASWATVWRITESVEGELLPESGRAEFARLLELTHGCALLVMPLTTGFAPALPRVPGHEVFAALERRHLA